MPAASEGLSPRRVDDATRSDPSQVDNVYALSLLEATGICVVPASGFGQKAGRAGFRTTFLPAEEALAAAVEQFASHHAAFCAEWA